MTMESQIPRNILLCLLSFLGLSAASGGGALIISPSGKLLGGLPLSILRNSPFIDFLIPGSILFFVLGLFPCLVVYALLKKPENKIAEKINFFHDMYWGWTFTIYIAFALIIWIQVESIYVQGVGWLQTFYMLFSIPLIFIALLPQAKDFYKKQK